MLWRERLRPPEQKCDANNHDESEGKPLDGITEVAALCELLGGNRYRSTRTVGGILLHEDQ
jgi:hypothetical protein